MAALNEDQFGRLTLESMLAPMTVAQFRETHLDRSPLVLRGAVDPSLATEVFGPSRLDEVLTSCLLNDGVIDVIDPKGKRMEAAPRTAGRLSVPEIVSLFGEGALVRIKNVERHCAPLYDACAALARDLGGAVKAAIFLSSSKSFHLPPHYDSVDVWILQTWGSKVWRFHESLPGHAELPDRAELYVNPVEAGFVGGYRELTLHPGDVMYVPRGLIHAPYCASGSSLHITFTAFGLTLYDVLKTELAKRRDRDVSLRRTLARDLVEPIMEMPEVPEVFSEAARVDRETLREAISSLLEVQAGTGSRIGHLPKALEIQATR